ncbi:PIN domain-containing protein [Bordetella ansorpii]|uniref:hypothetical protein n=1 Tax=Bordetella ansorpii TaxID=288768 RepID=UPI0039A0AFD6
MILLGTNVMSESLRHVPEHRVIDWIDAQAMETLFLSAITVAELQAGVALLPPGKRRAGLQQNLEKRDCPCSPAVCCLLTWPAPRPMPR